MHMATNSGLMVPVCEMVEMAHRAGAVVLLDACQSVGPLAMDVESLGVDAHTATGRKWPRDLCGTGFLVRVRLPLLHRSVLEGLELMAADLDGGVWSAPTPTSSDVYELRRLRVPTPTSSDTGRFGSGRLT